MAKRLSKQQQIEILFHMLKKNNNICKNWTCEMRKMQFIFSVPLNEELEGTLHPQKCWCTPKNEGKGVHVPPDEKTCGHADVYIQCMYIYIYIYMYVCMCMV